MPHLLYGSLMIVSPLAPATTAMRYGSSPADPAIPSDHLPGPWKKQFGRGCEKSGWAVV